ncbi:MAG: hypothetical protein M0C28_16215 [Candidatus Moduliflexus flocculans]|nr:hypothetical protein [Candidatus Moduliflexus flocculans]
MTAATPDPPGRRHRPRRERATRPGIAEGRGHGASSTRSFRRSPPRGARAGAERARSSTRRRSA